jgi:hypothetical protein
MFDLFVSTYTMVQGAPLQLSEDRIIWETKDNVDKVYLFLEDNMWAGPELTNIYVFFRATCF